MIFLECFGGYLLLLGSAILLGMLSKMVFCCFKLGWNYINDPFEVK